MLYKYSGILIMFFCSFLSLSQSDIVKSDSLSDFTAGDSPSIKSTFYIAGQLFKADRRFEDLSVNKKFDSLLIQMPINTGGIEAGVQIDLSKYVYLGIGLNYFGGGESWTYNDSISDSTFNYVNKYRQVAVPIRFNAQFGNKIKGYGFVGVIPSSILSRRYESSFTNANGTITENDIITSAENINSFQFIGSVGAGISYSFGHASVFAQLEYRQHFTNTYTGLFLNHHQNLLGGSIGLTFIL